MNTTLWTIQGILAIIFTASGSIIMLLPKEKSAAKLSWVNEYSDNTRLFICLSKIAGAAGLILPLWLNILPVLTPIAALGLATIMVLAMAYHIRKKEFKDVPATLLFMALALFIAYNRF
ncbi:MAG: DoxX family protein [Sphingobacteriales bacterium]